MPPSQTERNAREWTIHQIVHQLRHTALSNSGRPIDSTKPLGALGVGLDSLALLQFVTALENQFEIELPDNLWANYPDLSIDSLADIIQHLRKDRFSLPSVMNPDEYIADMDFIKPTFRERKSVRRIYREHGILVGMLASVFLLPARMIQNIARRDRFYIIAFDLETQPLPQFHAALPLTFRRVELDDLNTILPIWNKREQPAKTSLFKKRLEKGFLGFIALGDSAALGIDWLSPTGDTEEFMGVTISLQEGSCYGLDLNEHPGFGSQGVGMSLIAHVLGEAKERGFKTQYAIVHTSNTKMLGAALHLLGFKVVGKILTQRVFGNPYSHWKLHDQIGHGASLRL